MLFLKNTKISCIFLINLIYVSLCSGSLGTRREGLVYVGNKLYIYDEAKTVNGEILPSGVYLIEFYPRSNPNMHEQRISDKIYIDGNATFTIDKRDDNREMIIYNVKAISRMGDVDEVPAPDFTSSASNNVFMLNENNRGDIIKSFFS